MHFSIYNIFKSLNSHNRVIIISTSDHGYPTNSLCITEFVMQPKIYS